MEHLLHGAGPATPIFGPSRSQGTSYLWVSGGGRATHYEGVLMRCSQIQSPR